MTRASQTHPCACGCGELVSEGRMFRPGHWSNPLARSALACAAPGCDRAREVLTAQTPWCRKHYFVVRRHGEDPSGWPSAWNRFVDRVLVLASDCWQWMGNGTGRDHAYGTLWIGRRNVLAHRFSYETLVGPIPDGLELDHTCRLQRCVNPAHLEPVTPKVNMQRMHAAKKELRRAVG